MSWKYTHGDPCREQEFWRGNILIPCSIYCHRVPVYFPLCKEQIHLGEVSKFELCHQGTRWRPEPKLSGTNRNTRPLRGFWLWMRPWSTKWRGGCSFKTASELPLFIGCTIVRRPSHTDRSSGKSKGFKLKWKNILRNTSMTVISVHEAN